MMEEFLPVGWVKEKLADVIKPRGEKVSPSDFPEYKFIGMDHVESQTTKIIGSVPASEMKSNAARFYTGDVLYGRLRPYLNKVTQPQFCGLASAEFIVFPDTPLIKSSFLKYRLNAADFVNFASHLNEGDRPRVSFEQIGDFKLLIPPPNEQKRIVARIEELFSELDKGIESLEAAREQLKVYRQAVLKHAFEGKLTAEWRQSHSSFFERWKKILVHDIATVGTGATPKRDNKRYYEGGKHAWVTSGALNEDYVTQASEYITDAALEGTNCKLYPPNTILVAMYGEGKTRGKASILKITAATNQACAAITITDDSVLLSYLWNFFRYNYENIRRQSSGGVQPNLNLNHIKNIAFPLPPISEQIAINEQIETKFSCIYKMQEEIEQNLQRSESLRQSILKKAFSGKLVAQDPNDEPASVLLERIRAEKEFPVQQSWLPQVEVKEKSVV